MNTNLLEEHEGFTHMLFEDALMGLQCRLGRTQLQEMSLDALQRLYLEMKTAELNQTPESAPHAD